MIWQTTAELHSALAPKILPVLEGRPIEGTITSSDFGSEQPQQYLELVQELLEPVLDRFAREHNYAEWRVHRTWFQHYLPGDSHDWHVHPGCHFAGTYLVQGTGTTDVHTPEAWSVPESGAGTVTIFPAYTAHRAPPTEEPRTVIAFNFSVDQPLV